ncbi:MAG TPA: CapA family protein [Bacillota bacterium]|nr:CapA family protein [Clostridiales bacterium]HPU17152.1 CapA family protein [Bacillota bacterium]
MDARSRRRRGGNNYTVVFVVVFVIWFIIVSGIIISRRFDFGANDTDSTISETESVPGSGTESDNTKDSDTEPDTTDAIATEEAPVTYKEITLLSAGDIMFHMAQIEYAKAAGGNGTYDFTNTFKYIKDLVSSADYAVANFETTLAGDAYEYKGYPAFNSPDSTLDAIKDAGFDMLLFANNHCYDTYKNGLIRTQEKFIDYGFDYIGAKLDPENDGYLIVDINGIKVGMLNYADDLSGGITEPRYINGRVIREGDLGYMNLYNLSLLDEFYNEVRENINTMRDNGADIIIFYIHWGLEYKTKHNWYQEQVAQELCNLGVDVIIGGHPHVVQDVAILTNEHDSTKKTLCYYSLGNLVSNQNRVTLGEDFTNSRLTEGGLIVMLTIRLYSTGECLVVKAEAIPTWVHRYKTNIGIVHEIVPAKAALENPEAYGLTATSFGKKNAEEVYTATLNIIGGVTEAFNESVILPAVGGVE